MSAPTDSGELSVKLRLMNGIELDAKSDHPDGRKWLITFAERLYTEAKSQDEEEMIQGGYKPKQTEEVKTINR